MCVCVRERKREKGRVKHSAPHAAAAAGTRGEKKRGPYGSLRNK